MATSKVKATRNRVARSTGDEQSFTVKATVLHKLQDGKLAKILTFSPTVRTYPNRGIVGFLGALEYSLNEAGVPLGTFNKIVALDDSRATIELSEDVVLWIAYLRSGARCSVCGSLRTAPELWCDGDCAKWRKDGTPVAQMHKRAGFGALA